MEFEEFDIEFLAQKMSDNPESPLFARLADLYLSKEQTVEAIKLTEEGVKLFPNYCAGYIVLGKAHLAVKEFSQAISAFEKALELSPFNQTAAKLLQSVPNKSDESTRTTEENYFSPQPTTLSLDDQAEPVQEVVIQELPPSLMIQEQTPESIIHEHQFSVDAEEPSGSIYDQPDIQSSSVQHEIHVPPVSSEPFPSFDEYFAENQHRVTVDAEKKLDDYLKESSEGRSTAVLRDNNQAIFAQTAVETPAPEPEVHYDPEPVFSSPEQAQLYAEITREENSDSNENNQRSDLDSLTEKLQSAEKIVPQDNYQSKTPIPDTSQDDNVYETDAVTPTLAEIYASQGEFRAAIQAYEILMFSQPAKGGEYQNRIRELQQKQMEKDGLI